jgi:DUF4097 and DUF4098 domain-containing protein YvlB
MFRISIVATALVAGLAGTAWAQPPIQAKPGGPESASRTDQTLEVTKGSRLVLTNNAGEVVVRSWDRDQVRIQAAHSERERVEIQSAESTVRVRTRGTRGPASLVDYQVTVPAWMPVNLSGTYLEATVEGTSAEVTVETVHGNVRVVGGSGNVIARSVEGTITVEKAAGRVQATTVNEDIRVVDVTGDLTVDTTNGDITIDNAQAASLSASTVNGDVTFNGAVRDGGSYRLATHGGDIRLGLGGANNAIVFVRTFQGDFSADFPIQLPEGQSARSGSKRFNFTLGNGSARIELQTFNGDIELAKGRVMTDEERRQLRRKGGKPQAGHIPDRLDLERAERELEHALEIERDLDLDLDLDLDIDLDLDLQSVPGIPAVNPIVVPPAPPAAPSSMPLDLLPTPPAVPVTLPVPPPPPAPLAVPPPRQR